MTSNWWRQRVRADDAELFKSFWSQNSSACGVTRGLLYKEYISIQCNKSWLWSPKSLWLTLTMSSGWFSPDCAAQTLAPVWWLKPVYASHYFMPLSVSHQAHDAMCLECENRANFLSSEEGVFLQQYMIRSFNVIVMRPIYSLEWMFSSFSQGQGRRVAWKTKTMINLKVLTPWMTHLYLN